MDEIAGGRQLQVSLGEKIRKRDLGVYKGSAGKVEKNSTAGDLGSGKRKRKREREEEKERCGARKFNPPPPLRKEDRERLCGERREIYVEGRMTVEKPDR